MLLLGSLHYRVGKWAAFVQSQLGVPQVSSVVGFFGFSPLYVCLMFYHSSQIGGMLALFCFVHSLKIAVTRYRICQVKIFEFDCLGYTFIVFFLTYALKM